MAFRLHLRDARATSVSTLAKNRRIDARIAYSDAMRVL